MQLDALQVLTNLFVGVVGAWVAGTFAIRHGLERAKRERAFDRQLEWRERTIRAINRFLTSEVEFANVVTFATPGFPDEDIRVLLKTLEGAVDELDVSLEESLLFAERKIVIDLRDHIFSLQDLITQIKERDRDPSYPRGIAETTDNLAKSFRKLSISLSQSVRKQLDLDDISPDDLKTKLDKWVEAQKAQKST